jgi:lipid II:glycine glycyltransferase (peptidoglycan interpeptide bridge formation enzyme)
VIQRREADVIRTSTPNRSRRSPGTPALRRPGALLVVLSLALWLVSHLSGEAAAARTLKEWAAVAKQPRRVAARGSHNQRVPAEGREGPGGYRLRLSSQTRDPEWDRFLAGTPGGHHLQSTHWAEVKSMLGWRALRVVVVRDGRIHGGAQVLIRPLPVIGSVGYVALGPVLGSDDPALRRLLVQSLHTVGRDNRMLFLVVQPPAGRESIVADLRTAGFHEADGLVTPHPTATVVTDLSQDEEALLAAMRKTTRYNIRSAQRRGVRIREGGEQDVAVFYRLLTMTSQRQRFPIPSEEYFRDMLRIMGPDGHAKIFLAEFGDEPLSAALLIAFGETVSLKRAAWSGSHGRLHPNNLLQWTVMRWAKEEGYRYYDFEGIDRPSTASADGSDPTPGSFSSFKLGFGGTVVLSPGAYEHIHNPVLRRAYHPIVRHLLGSAPGRWAVDTIRNR